MDHNHARAKAIQILEFWHKVEFFIPYDLDRVAGNLNPTCWLSREALEAPFAEQLAWLHSDSHAQECSYQLYLGVFDGSDVEEVCRRSGLAENDFVRHMENAERSKEGDHDHTCFAKVAIGTDGQLNLQRFSVSSLPWALHRLESGAVAELSAASFERAKDELGMELQNFASELKRSSDPEQQRRLTGHGIVQLTELLFRWAGYQPTHKFLALLEVLPPQKKGKNENDTVAGEEEEQEDDEPISIDILNSFYLADLERAIKAIEAGEEQPILEAYLGFDSSPKIDLYSAQGRELIIRQLRPALMNSARWLEAPERVMSLMQQFAINTIFEALSQTGLYSVNGPPGTGKTTMLREMIAENILRRARALSRLDAPEHAWKRQEAVTFPKEEKPYTIAVLDDSLTGFEMVVASSNNTAVENISKDLPQPRSKDKTWDAVTYLRPVALKVFADHKDGRVVGLKQEDKPWGLLSGVLGKKANRDKLCQRLIYDPDSGEDANQRKRRGEYLNVRDWSDQYAGVSFEDAKEAFKKINRDVRHRLDELEELAIFEAKFGSISEQAYGESELRALTEAEELTEEAREEKAKAEATLVWRQEARRQREREQQLLERMKPDWWTPWKILSAPEMDRRTKLRENLAAQLALSEQIRQAEERLQVNLGPSCDAAVAGAAEALRLFNQRKSEFQRGWERLSTLRAGFKGLCLPHSLEDLETDDYQERALWQDAALNHLRSGLFAAALQVHESWLAAVLKRGKGFRPNVIAIAKLLQGKLPADPNHILAIWQSLFLIVPVISSTFASFEKQFRGLPPNAIGWLFVDEAGQAVPQAAVGALRKSRRAVVIGDPMQIEPIFGVPIRLIENLANEDRELIEKYAPQEVSVQSLADAANAYGTFTGGETKTWVGSPLRVHRRCANPMFEVANHIAYQDKMIQGRTDYFAEIDMIYGDKSCWFDIGGMRSDGQYIPAQGEFILRKMTDFYLVQGRLPAVYLISPFRKVAEQLRHLLRSEEAWIRRLPPGFPPPKRNALRTWVSTRIGTVHTFQGKEEDTVFFVLGADRDSPGSALWAASKPNLLNVALTRARHRFYVVGDRQLWGTKQYFNQLAGKLDSVKDGRVAIA